VIRIVFTMRRQEMKTKKHIGKSVIGISPKPGEVNIKETTASYEKWMRRCTTVISSDLLSKHEQMKESPFLFLRGTFYRWSQQWSSICTELCNAPQVLAVGDLHVNSLGPGESRGPALLGSGRF
jgi:hypothetical protein